MSNPWYKMLTRDTKCHPVVQNVPHGVPDGKTMRLTKIHPPASRKRRLSAEKQK